MLLITTLHNFKKYLMEKEINLWVRKMILPLLILFVIINGVVFFVQNQFAQLMVETTVLYITNTILFILSIVHIIRSVYSLKNINPHGFTKIIYSGFVIRLFVCIIAAFIYIYIRSPRIHKLTLFGAMGIYFIYTLAEAGLLKLLLKIEKENGKN